MAKTRKAIVVGTGAGGLSAAAHLAKDGLEVVALDQADRIGGFLAPFSIDGYSFDPGVHYIGQAGRGQMLDQVLSGLGLDVEKLFVGLDPEGFDVYRFPDFEVKMCAGPERYRDRLIERFPADHAGLRRLFDLIGHYGEASRGWPLGSPRPHLSDLRGLRHMPQVMRWARSSQAALFAQMLHDPRARAVLAAPNGCVGMPPSRLSALVALGLLHHYLGGAFYPRGGSGALRDALVACARGHGASFRTGAEVVEIMVRGSSVRGVRLASGEEIEAEVVISDLDPTVTFGKLLARASLPEKLTRKVERTEPSLSAFTLFLGMKRDLRALGLGAFNVWQYPSWDLDETYGPVLAGRIPDRPGFFLSSSTSRDDSGTLAPPGCSTLQIVVFMPWQPFARWGNLRPGERGEEYRQLKQGLTDRLLAQVERAWPGLVGDVAVQSVATPLTERDYTRGVMGGIYGPAHSVEQIGPGRFATTTPIDGLLLAGAGVLSCGVASCMLSGRMAADLASGRRLTPVAREASPRAAAMLPPL